MDPRMRQDILDLAVYEWQRNAEAHDAAHRDALKAMDQYVCGGSMLPVIEAVKRLHETERELVYAFDAVRVLRGPALLLS